jgi:hypothetical protein
VPSYCFVVRKPDGGTVDPPRWTNLSNDQSAIAYARLIIRHLKQAGQHGDPSLTLLAQNAEGEMIASIPFMS